MCSPLVRLSEGDDQLCCRGWQKVRQNDCLWNHATDCRDHIYKSLKLVLIPSVIILILSVLFSDYMRKKNALSTTLQDPPLKQDTCCEIYFVYVHSYGNCQWELEEVMNILLGLKESVEVIFSLRKSWLRHTHYILLWRISLIFFCSLFSVRDVMLQYRFFCHPQNNLFFRWCVEYNLL